jgi:hypothetical protein
MFICLSLLIDSILKFKRVEHDSFVLALCLWFITGSRVFMMLSKGWLTVRNWGTLPSLGFGHDGNQIFFEKILYKTYLHRKYLWPLSFLSHLSLSLNASLHIDQSILKHQMCSSTFDIWCGVDSKIQGKG